MINNEWFGFRNNISTDDALINVIGKIINELDIGNKCLGIFLDLRKAFDTINHNLLLDKLHTIGVRGVFVWCKVESKSVLNALFLSQKTSVMLTVTKCKVGGENIEFVKYPLHSPPSCQKFADSKPAEDDRLLRLVKIVAYFLQKGSEQRFPAHKDTRILRIPTRNTILRWVASFRITGSTLKKKSPGRNSIALRLSEATVISRALRLLSLGPFEGRRFMKQYRCGPPTWKGIRFWDNKLRTPKECFLYTLHPNTLYFPYHVTYKYG
ncbi:hypothetical protein ANN_16991 [Periplaneta americana]|uniref:Reverse transcriptase domain-containing protein n=1 Tax=Periplaneta americana TaxID=6978 RepID=A0ABQ8SRN4_PERAM|nr:hypothetical protein ANN_16991 [Periplaneta americana]